MVCSELVGFAVLGISAAHFFSITAKPFKVVKNRIHDQLYVIVKSTRMLYQFYALHSFAILNLLSMYTPSKVMKK